MIVIFNVLWTIFIGVKIPLESIQLNGLEMLCGATHLGFESLTLRQKRPFGAQIRDNSE